MPGFVLLGLIAGNDTGMTAIALYLFVYTFMNLGAWSITVALRRRDVIGEQVEDLNGLFFKHSTAAVLMLVFMLSLAGIPPTAGFIAKYYLFAAVIETGHTTLAVIAALNVAIGLYYYMRIVVAMFMSEATEKTDLTLSPGSGFGSGRHFDSHPVHRPLSRSLHHDGTDGHARLLLKRCLSGLDSLGRE